MLFLHVHTHSYRLFLRLALTHEYFDFFAHSGTTLLAAEIAGRKCFTAEIDPVFCEMAIRRVERYRTTGKTGWQNGHAFESSLDCGSTVTAQDTDDAPPTTQDTLF